MWLLRNQVIWVVALCDWVISSQSFEEMYCLHLLGYETIHRLIIQKMKVVCTFETLGSDYPTIQCNNPEDLLPQCENRFATKQSFSAVSFPVAKQQASCLTPPYFSLQYYFSFSLVTQVTRGIAVITITLFPFKQTLCITHPCELSLYVSLSCFKV